MKALTIWPEWAALIAHGIKPVENRSWRPPASLVGERIAIHAGAHIGGRKGIPAFEEAAEAVGDTAFDAGLRVNLHSKYIDLEGKILPIILGAVVATAILGEPYRPRGGPWESPDPDGWCWPLKDVVRLRTPVPSRGKQGLWEWPMDWSPLVCPMCGIAVKWHRWQGSSGWADCQDGTRVSRRWPNIAKDPCPWEGARTRFVDGRMEWEVPRV